METLGLNQEERDAERREANRRELVQRIMRAVPEDGVVQALEGLYLARVSKPGERLHSVVKPSLCVIAQGGKEVLIGDSRYRYDAARYLIATVELPRISRVLKATLERPYLSFRLVLSPAVVSSVIIEAGDTTLPQGADVRATAVSPLDVELQEAVLRLVRLLDDPATAPILMPLISREIVYRLLLGRQGARLRHLMIRDGYNPLIARAVERLRSDVDQPLQVEQLANELGMSVSSFHHQFKAVTEISPMQFRKRVRLQEARRLMLSENLDAATAGFRVGYHDAAHFSREYKSLFGDPPLRDVLRLREEALRTDEMRPPKARILSASAPGPAAPRPSPDPPCSRCASSGARR